MKDKIKEVLAKVLKINISEINDDFSQTDCHNWTSLQHLALVFEIETETGLSFEPEEISQMTSLKKIMQIVNEK